MRDDLFARGVHDGYLAYVEGAPVGWVQAGPRDDLPKIAETFSLDPDPDAWAICCFMVLAPYRGQGLGRRIFTAVARRPPEPRRDGRRGLPAPRHRPRGRGRVDGARVAVRRGRLHRASRGPRRVVYRLDLGHLTRRATPAVSLAPFRPSNGARLTATPGSAMVRPSVIPRPCAAAHRTSRRCRGGAARAGTCRAAGRRHSGTPGSSAAASPRLASVTGREHGRHDLGGLGQHRRAGRVEHHPAGPHGVERRRQAAPAAAARARRGRRAAGASAPRAGAAAHRGRCRVRRPAPGRTTLAATAGGCRRPPPRRARRPPRRAHVVPVRRGGAGARWRARRHRARRPAPRAARPCRPARRTGRASAGPGRRAGPPPARGRPAGSPRPAPPPGPRRPRRRRPGRPTARWTPYGDQRRRLAGQLVAGRAAGTRDQGDAGRFVVGSQQRLDLVATDRRGERLDDPPRVGVRDRQVPEQVGVARRRDPADPAVEVVLAHPPQHRVGEPGRTRPDVGAHQRDGRRDRRVRRHPHRQQLVGAQPQRVEHPRLHLGQRPVDAGGEHGVVQALAAYGSGRQLGRERRVAAGEPVPPQGRRAARGWCRRRPNGPRAAPPAPRSGPGQPRPQCFLGHQLLRRLGGPGVGDDLLELLAGRARRAATAGRARRCSP